MQRERCGAADRHSAAAQAQRCCPCAGGSGSWGTRDTAAAGAPPRRMQQAREEGALGCQPRPPTWNVGMAEMPQAAATASTSSTSTCGGGGVAGGQPVVGMSGWAGQGGQGGREHRLGHAEPHPGVAPLPSQPASGRLSTAPGSAPGTQQHPPGTRLPP